MKSLISIFALSLVFTFVSCDDDEPKGYAGSWKFSLPNHQGSFEITGNDPYSIRSIVVNGKAWTTGSFYETGKTEIGSIILQSATEDIIFVNCKASLDFKTMSNDSAIHRPTRLQNITYKNINISRQ
jgi:hypothetical protein